MAIAVAQTAFNAASYNNTGSGTTVAITVTVSAGSTLVVWVTWDDTATKSCSVADPTNGSYTSGPVNNDTAASQCLQRFYRQNVVAGSTTITATFGATTDFRGIGVAEVTGAVTTGGADGSSGNIQAAPGTGTDAITTASMTNAAQPALIVACSMDVTGSAVPAAGTGFTSNGSNASLLWRVESKRLTTTSSTQAATFTAGAGGGSDGYITAGFIFDEAAGGGTTVSLTGQGATSTAGSPAVVVACAATGQAAASAGGTLAAQAALTATGASAASAGGSPAVATALALGGQAATSAGGTVSPQTSGTATLTGQAMTATAGSLLRASALLRNWVGQEAVSGGGTVSPQSAGAATLTGLPATSAAGTPAPSVTIPLSGQQSTTAAGAVAPSTAALATLTGLQAAAAGGAATPGTTGRPAGIAAASAAGTLTASMAPSTDTFALAPCPPTMAIGLTFTRANGIAAPTRAQ